VILNPEANDDVTISQAARACSAAPTYFDPVQIGGTRFTEGGLAEANPSLLAWNEVMGRESQNKQDIAGGLFVSISSSASPKILSNARKGTGTSIISRLLTKSSGALVEERKSQSALSSTLEQREWRHFPLKSPDLALSSTEAWSPHSANKHFESWRAAYKKQSLHHETQRQLETLARALVSTRRSRAREADRGRKSALEQSLSNLQAQNIEESDVQKIEPEPAADLHICDSLPQAPEFDNELRLSAPQTDNSLHRNCPRITVEPSLNHADPSPSDTKVKEGGDVIPSTPHSTPTNTEIPLEEKSTDDAEEIRGNSTMSRNGLDNLGP
jgi:hypothetical protein